jgi:DNA polymerase III subunit delta
MIVKFFDLKKNLKNNINFYLLYGQNSGLIEETIDNILKPNLSINIFNYDESEILSNMDKFKEGIFSKSFFDEDKLIIINRSTDKILHIIEEIVDKNIKDLKIIIKSEVLEKKSKLRKFFENNNNLIIIPFYEDNYQSLTSIAQKNFKEKKIRISTQNINYIVERAKGNRINLKNELKKIENYCQKKKSIEFNEITKLTNLSENYDVTELVNQCIAKNKKKTLHILNENNSAFEDNIVILKTFLYKLKRLKKLKNQLEIKDNIDTAISSFRPPIFWKEKDIIKQQLKIWSLSQIRLLITKVSDLELIVKKNSEVSSRIINNFILENLEISNN